MKHRLRWLGHLARMEPNCLPKHILYGELDKKRPRHGTRKRWRDVATPDINAVGASEDWYEVAQDRQAWQALCRDGISSLVEQHSQVGLQELHPQMEIQPTSVHVGNPVAGEVISQDTSNSVQLLAQLGPNGPKPLYSGHYLRKDTIIILQWTAFKVSRFKVCVCARARVCVCVHVRMHE